MRHRGEGERGRALRMPEAVFLLCGKDSAEDVLSDLEWRSQGERRAVVGLLTGCVQRAFFGHVNAATARVLAFKGRCSV